MALLVLPFSLVAVVSHKMTYSGPWCQIQGFFSTVVIVTLQLNLLVISLDRNYAIMNSLRYTSVFTQRLCTIFTSGSWAVAIVLSIPPLFKEGMGEYTFQPYQFICALDWGTDAGYLIAFSIIAFIFPILVESRCYIRIFIAAVSHTKNTARVYPSISVTRSTKLMRDNASDSSESSDGASSVDSKHHAAGCKAVRTIFLTALFYSICWVPYFTSSSLKAIYHITFPHLSAASICLLYSSGILNPIIYVYLNRVIRREIGKFLCGSTSQSESDDFLSTSMSNFSSAKQAVSVWSAQRIRSRSAGGQINEMGTIVEESEDTAVIETRSECNLHLGASSSHDIENVRHKLTTQTRSNDNDDRNDTKSPAIIDKFIGTCETSVQSSDVVVFGKTTLKCKQDSFIASKTESRTKDNISNIPQSHRRTSRSNSFAYFSSAKRRKKRDCGSFLYFEHDDIFKKLQEARDSEKMSEKARKNERYSLDHKISMSSLPKILRFRLSVTDIHDRVNRVTVHSNLRLKEQKSSSDVSRTSCTDEIINSVGYHEENASEENVLAISKIEVKPSIEGATGSVAGSNSALSNSPIPSQTVSSTSIFPEGERQDNVDI